MIKNATRKLALSLLGASVVSFVLSLIIVVLVGSVTSFPTVSSSSKTSGSSASVSSSMASSSKNLSSSELTSAAVSQMTKAPSGMLLDSTGGKVFIGIICSLLFLVLIYNVAWHEGSNDPNRVKYGHMHKFMAKGFVAGLLASIPNMVVFIIFLISTLLYPGAIIDTISSAIYRVINIQFVVFNDAVLKIPTLSFIYLLPLPIVSGASYIMGYKQIFPVSKILYKKQKSAQNKNISGLKR